MLQDVAQKIIKEVKDIHFDKDNYKGRINIGTAKRDVIPTLSKLLSLIEPTKLQPNALASILIGNMVTSQEVYHPNTEFSSHDQKEEAGGEIVSVWRGIFL